METLQISIDKQIADVANSYAEARGESLSTIIETYLKQMVSKINVGKVHEAEVPDVVMSLLGAGLPIDSDDINGRKAYAEHIDRKHR